MRSSAKISRVVGTASSKRKALPSVSIDVLIEKLAKVRSFYGVDFDVELDIDKSRPYPVEVVMSGSYTEGMNKVVITNSRVK